MKLSGRGPVFDRNYMLVDSDGQFISRRTVPELTRFDCAIEDVILVRHANDSVSLPLSIASGKRMQVQVWNDKVDAFHVADSVDQWFSERIGRQTKLVYMPTGEHRQVDRAYAPAGTNVSFADGFPYLVLGESSIEDLNHRLEIPVGIERFRPNILFSGGSAYIEDTFSKVAIGNAVFAGPKLCARCNMTTLDVKRETYSKEPLLTLSTYRKTKDGVMFGMNLFAVSGDSIKVGDSVSIFPPKPL